MYWDEDYSFNDDMVSTPLVPYVHPSEARSAYGWTDFFSMTPMESSSTLASHQATIPRLPIPELRDTCALYLDSLVGVLTAEEYHSAKKAVDAFLAPGGSGEVLQGLLKKREADMAAPTTPLEKKAPSWLEPWWDDAYLLGRDPLPINVNYCFGFEPHPAGPGTSFMEQAWRAAALLYSALGICLDIRRGTFPLDYEKGSGGAKAPLDMSQLTRVFGASRIPDTQRDFIITYTTTPPTPVDSTSKTSRYVLQDPSHIVVLCRNRFFMVTVLADGSILPVGTLYGIFRSILRECEKKGTKGGPPVGVFTTEDRTKWAQHRDELLAVHTQNQITLEVIQSALLVVVPPVIPGDQPKKWG
jgi:carnitine O-acetyltransferase